MALFSKLTSKTPLGIYIHVPFCRSKCQYCDFYSITAKDDKLLSRFTDAICQHVREAGALAPGYRVDTIYFGGGTPSFFGAEGMAMILAAIRRSFDVAGDAEITFEANPDSISEKLLRRLKAEGFNRVSMGVQSDDDTMLRRLGRPHTYAQAVLAASRIRKAGFRNISIDLMYGLPGQSMEAWEGTLHHVMSMNPDHISCYGLKVEERTPLWSYKDSCGIPDDDTQADMYLTAVEFLKARGYRQYEISNFAKKGLISRHNMKYWMGGEYLGFGPDASSDFAGKRFTFVRDVYAYIDGIRRGESIISDVQEVPPRERAGEYLMTRLRTTTGISQEEYEKQFLLPFAPLEEKLYQCESNGLAHKTSAGRWYLTPEGMLVSNSIISDLLILQDESQPINRWTK